jgi:hypothetical protein
MDVHGELLPDDHFRREDEEHWMNYQEWRESLRKRTVIKPSQRILSHTERVTIDQKRRNVEMRGHIQSHPTLSRARQMQSAHPVDDSPEGRLARMVASINDHRREQGHNHPFHFAEAHLIADAIVWLDFHHAGWDRRVADPLSSGSRADVLDKWLIPALARVHPDLVKSSHRMEFERGTRWNLPS